MKYAIGAVAVVSIGWTFVVFAQINPSSIFSYNIFNKDSPIGPGEVRVLKFEDAGTTCYMAVSEDTSNNYNPTARQSISCLK